MREFFDNLRNSEFFRNKKNIIILAVLLLALPVGIFLITQQQIFKSRASGERIEFSGPNVETREGRKVATKPEVTLKLNTTLSQEAPPPPTPSPSPPTPPAPPTPTNLSASCPVPGTTTQFSWSGNNNSTTYYELFIDNKVNAWGNYGTGIDSANRINSPTNSFNATSLAGNTYGWWMRACNSVGCSSESYGTEFTCTQAPSPVQATASITASPTTITAGTAVTLSWSSTNATKCYLSYPGVGSKDVGTSGSDVYHPETTTTYSIRCEAPGAASSKTESVTVTVNPALPCTGKSGTGCSFDTLTTWYNADGTRGQSITIGGKYWNYTSPSGGVWNLSGSGDLAGVSYYKVQGGPCEGKSAGTCRFDTQSVWDKPDKTRSQSITIGGKYWNYDSPSGGTWNLTGSGNLADVAWYAAAGGPCEGKSGTGCSFDTLTTWYYPGSQTRGQSITISGKYWNYNSDSPGNWTRTGSGDLAPTFYKDGGGPCAGKSAGTCRFDTQSMWRNPDGTRDQSITIGGKYWNYHNPTSGGWTLTSNGNLADVAWYK